MLQISRRPDTNAIRTQDRKTAHLTSMRIVNWEGALGHTPTLRSFEEESPGALLHVESLLSAWPGSAGHVACGPSYQSVLGSVMFCKHVYKSRLSHPRELAPGPLRYPPR
jgi:hypothetical protein